MLNTALTNPSPFTANVYQLAGSCRKEESWQTQVRGFATYTCRRPTFSSAASSGSSRTRCSASARRPKATAWASRPIYATVVNGAATTVNLVAPGRYYADRINQIDMRFGKIFNFGNKRTNIAIDVLEPVQREHRDGVPAELRRRLAVSVARRPS